MQVVKELPEVQVPTAIHPRRRIAVLLREDGNYTFAEQYHYIVEDEGVVITEGWHTLSPNGVYASAELAESEGLAEFRGWHGSGR